jgi:small nuclear ribonucleoprotein (snRNP)-like protein
MLNILLIYKNYTPNMENEFNLFTDFIGKQICIKQNDSTEIVGTLVSIDGYLNTILSDAEYISDIKVNIKTLFIRGSVIDYISK